MKEDFVKGGKWLGIAALVSAGAASLCCIGPAVFVALGLGGLGVFAAFERARPFFMGLTAAVLGAAFYHVCRRREAVCAGGSCKTEGASPRAKAALWALPLYALLAWPRPSAANGPPIHGDTAFVVGIEGAGVRGAYQESRRAKLLRDGQEIPDPQEGTMTVRMVTLMLPYEAVPNRLLIGFAVPYLDKRMESTIAGRRTALTNRGLGDTTVFGKYQLLQRDRPGGTTRLAGKLGLKLPTGKDDARDAAGALLPPGLQLGSGSWDASGGVVVTHLHQRWGINANLVYALNNEAKGFENGDALRYDLSGAFRLLPRVYGEYPSPQFNLILELNGVTAWKDGVRGAADPDSGGHTLLLSPGLQLMGGRDWLVDASYQLPVNQELNGTQLGLDHAWTVGLLVYLRR